MNTDGKVLKKILANQILQHIKIILYTMTKCDLSGMQGWFNIKSFTLIGKREKPHDHVN